MINGLIIIKLHWALLSELQFMKFNSRLFTFYAHCHTQQKKDLQIFCNRFITPKMHNKWVIKLS